MIYGYIMIYVCSCMGQHNAVDITKGWALPVWSPESLIRVARIVYSSKKMCKVHLVIFQGRRGNCLGFWWDLKQLTSPVSVVEKTLLFPKSFSKGSENQSDCQEYSHDSWIFLGRDGFPSRIFCLKFMLLSMCFQKGIQHRLIKWR